MDACTVEMYIWVCILTCLVFCLYCTWTCRKECISGFACADPLTALTALVASLKQWRRRLLPATTHEVVTDAVVYKGYRKQESSSEMSVACQVPVVCGWEVTATEPQYRQDVGARREEDRGRYRYRFAYKSTRVRKAPPVEYVTDQVTCAKSLNFQLVPAVLYIKSVLWYKFATRIASPPSRQNVIKSNLRATKSQTREGHKISLSPRRLQSKVVCDRRDTQIARDHRDCLAKFPFRFPIQAALSPHCVFTKKDREQAFWSLLNAPARQQGSGVISFRLRFCYHQIG